MISEKMKPLVANNSGIRAMFELGKSMAAEYGAENVYDFSLGNPNVPAPEEVKDSILEILAEEDPVMVHGYMSNAGFEDVRETVADSLNKRFGTHFGLNNIIMVVGAASGMNVVFKTILNPGDEVIVFAPYFLEYGNYIRNFDAVPVVISPDTETFMPNLEEFEQKISPKTKAVIINTPNNPTGVVYPAETLKAIAAIMEKKQKEYGTDIFLISDEPYRELAYDDVEVPYVTPYYANTIVCYSYSKSLSLPGERIGYVVIPDEVDDSETMITAATIANRVLGSVNAPSLMQRVIKRCIEKDAKVNVAAYDRNRELLYNSLTGMGFTCAKPQGAFYLFMKTPTEDDNAFVEQAQKYHILICSGTSFACPGYVRIAYCVAYDTIQRSLPAFSQLAKDYGLGG